MVIRLGESLAAASTGGCAMTTLAMVAPGTLIKPLKGSLSQLVCSPWLGSYSPHLECECGDFHRSPTVFAFDFERFRGHR